MSRERMPHIPPMPEGFTDRAAWDAIHWQFKAVELYERPSVLDGVVMQWQQDNQERVLAAMAAAAKETK